MSGVTVVIGVEPHRLCGINRIAEVPEGKLSFVRLLGAKVY